MSKPVDFCRKRYGHLRKLMQEQELDLVYLLGGGQRLKRIADTTSGAALIVPLDSEPRLFCYSVDINSTREESWVPVEEIMTRVRQTNRSLTTATRTSGKAPGLGSSRRASATPLTAS